MKSSSASLITQFWRDDRGAAYSISVVLMLPFIIAFICLSVETALLFISKEALNTASQTAVHVGRAWVGHEETLEQNGESMETMMQQAIARTLTPFASARADQSHATSPRMQTLASDLRLEPLASERLSQKHASFEKITRVTLNRDRRGTDGIAARIEFDVPLWTPFVSKLFQNTVNADGHPARTIATKVWIPLSESDARRTGIGIPYSPQASTDWPKE